MNVWLVGHGGFYNRGCEAIVRSSSMLLDERFGHCRYTLWSRDRSADAVALHGEPFRVLDARKRRGPLDLCRVTRKVARLPGGKLVQRVIRRLPGTPACALSIGGDNFTLDYGGPRRHADMGRLLMDAGVPFVVWGASVGPFGADPQIENEMRDFFQRVDLITARESVSVQYLKSLGITHNVVQVFDPAFALDPQPYEGPEVQFVASGNVVGINISALIVRWFPDKNLERMLDQVAGFVDVVTGEGFKVLLVPHVTKKDGSVGDNDHRVMQMLLSRVERRRHNVMLLGANASARQVKWMISRCRFFVGARTHATIAAFSTGVPTIAIAYSQKARGICRDLFGNEDYLLTTSRLSTAALLEAWERLVANELTVREVLEQKRQDMLQGARRNAEALAHVLGRCHLRHEEN